MAGTLDCLGMSYFSTLPSAWVEGVLHRYLGGVPGWGWAWCCRQPHQNFGQPLLSGCVCAHLCFSAAAIAITVCIAPACSETRSGTLVQPSCLSVINLCSTRQVQCAYSRQTRSRGRYRRYCKHSSCSRSSESYHFSSMIPASNIVAQDSIWPSSAALAIHSS